jgi:ABC-type transport system involved in Fe-S cluster assembly fused permease/ATPase subunit
MAHRLATQPDTERILVVDSGRIMEIGTYTELIRRNGQMPKAQEMVR